MSFLAAFEPDAGKRYLDAPRRNQRPPVTCKGCGSDLAVMSEIDHRAGEGLERVVRPADAFEAQQGPAELVLPGALVRE